jgi:hypothetical protein
MKVYTYSQARQQLSLVLDQASREGGIQIRRRDGRLFVVKPVRRGKSPLDVAGITTDVSTGEIVQIIREGRERDFPYGEKPAGDAGETERRTKAPAKPRRRRFHS